MDLTKEQAVAALQATDESNMLAGRGYEIERSPAGWRLTPTVNVALLQPYTEHATLEEALAAAGGSSVTVRP